MKPLMLTMEGFGQYLAKQTVDFRQLDRLFLITGPTGAGKTTIFDAMSYALYGLGLGSRTEAAQLRSQLANEQQSTIVTLEFEVNGQRWTVERSPHVFLRVKRTGAADVDHYVKLWTERADGSRIDIPPREIQDKIHQLLGLEHKDFSKILVLPQGRFQEFLEMGSKDRLPLLKSMFPVEDHVRIAEFAKQRVSSVETELERLVSSLEELRREFDDVTYPQDRGDLDNRIRELENSGEQSRAFSDIAAKAFFEGQQLAKLIGQREIASEALATHLEQEADTLAAVQQLAQARRAMNVSPVVARVETGRAAIADVHAALVAWQARHDTATTRCEQLREAFDALPARKDAVTVLRDSQRDRLQRKNDLNAVQQAQKARLDAAAVLARAQTSMTRAEDAQRVAQSTRSTRDALAVRREETRVQRDTARQVLAECMAHQEDVTRLAEWNDSLQAAEKRNVYASAERVDAARQALAASEAGLAALETRLQGNAALAVASLLVEGEPCPACGSREHPQPYQGTHQEINGVVEDVREIVARDRRTLSSCESAYAAALAAMATKQATVDSLFARLQQAGFTSLADWENTRSLRSADVARWQQALVRIESDLDALGDVDQALASAQALFEQASSTLASAATACSLRDQEYIARQQSLGITDDDDIPVLLVRLQADMDATAGKIAVDEKDITEIEARWSSLTQTLATLAGEKTQLEHRRDTLLAAQPAFDHALSDALHEQGFSDVQAVAAATLSEKQMTSLETAIQAWHTRHAVLEKSLTTLEDSIQGRPAPDLETLENEAGLARSRWKSQTEALQSARDALQRLNQQAERFFEVSSQWAARQEDSAAMRAVSERLNGKAGQRVDFATWMLSWWLDQVLAQATLHLGPLTDGRYTLVRQQALTDGRRHQGLDILVLDHWSNDTREVRSLSGGEKFLASVSLALALADVVQASSGGIRIETLFIDEGFGSLDADNLERVLAALEELSSGRAVGVISHVEALKSIQSRIEVNKSHTGSTLQVV